MKKRTCSPKKYYLKIGVVEVFDDKSKDDL